MKQNIIKKHKKQNSVYHDARVAVYSIVVSIVHVGHKIVIAVANLHYCIGPIMRASITRTVPHNIVINISTPIRLVVV